MGWGPFVTGGLAGAVVSAVVNIWLTWRSIAHTLLCEGLKTYALHEAWILEGNGYEQATLSQEKALPPEDAKNGNRWLRSVELRAVFEQAPWNLHAREFYGFLEGKRAWIVRDTVKQEETGQSRLRHGEAYPRYAHPALVSSRGIDELCGWIERVAYARSVCLVGNRGLRMLEPVLESVARADVTAFLKSRLTLKSQKFLPRLDKWYQEERDIQKIPSTQRWQKLWRRVKHRMDSLCV